MVSALDRPKVGSIQDMLRRQDLHVVEIAESDVIQKIVIEHNPITQSIKWTISRMSPTVALGVLMRAAYSIFRDGFKKAQNPDVTMNILISYENGTVIVKSDRLDDPTMIASVISLGLMSAVEHMQHEGNYSEMADDGY